MKKKTKRKKSPIYDRTYRVEPGEVNYWKEAQRLLGQRIVVYMPNSRKWKRGYLVGIIPGWDVFRIKWTRKSDGRNLSGIWRVHTPSLFSAPPLLPVPREPARVPPTTNQQSSQGGRMATKPKPAATKAKAKVKKPAAEPEAKATRRDKLEGLSEAKRRNIAKLIYRERSKSPATSWGDIGEMIEAKYDWTLPGSMTGRRLLRDYGPDGAEEAIIKQDRTAKAETKATKKKKATKKVKAPVVEEDEDEDEDEEELEDEELDEEDEDEEDEDEEDEDEDEDEEEEAPKPKAKKVKVTRGRGRKPNPS